MTTTISARPTSAAADLSTRRLNVLRAGYLFMGGGLVLVKWPLLPDAHSLPLYEGVTLSLLTALSVPALLGLRYPRALLPVLLAEVAWKIVWLSLVALPRAVSDEIDERTGEVLVNCAFIVVIIAVVPWGYVWRRYVTAPGDPWR